LTPAPKARLRRQFSQSEDRALRLVDDSTIVADSSSATNDSHNKAMELSPATGSEGAVLSSSPKTTTTTFMMRRSSAGADGLPVQTTIPVRANFDELRQHLKHLGPSNPALNPKNTRSTTVKIKPGHVHPTRSASLTDEHVLVATEGGDETTGLLRPQITGKDGIQALRQSYGGVNPVPAVTVRLSPQEGDGMSPLVLETVEQANKSTQTAQASGQAVRSPQDPAKRSSTSDDSSRSGRIENAIYGKPAYVRSGSITENVVESRGVRKVVLETTSSNDEDEFAVVTTSSSPGQTQAVAARTASSVVSRDEAVSEPEDGEEEEALLPPGVGGGDGAGESGGGKKKRRKKRKGGKS